MKTNQRITLGVSACLSIVAACNASVISGVDGTGGGSTMTTSAVVVGVGAKAASVVAVAVVSSSGGNGGSDQGTGGASPDTPATTPAHTRAIPFDALPAPSGSAPSIQADDPSSMVFFLSSTAESCTTGELTPQSGATVWQAALVIPTSELVPGRISVSKVSLYTYVYYAGGGGGGGGGPLPMGPIWVDAVSDTQISLTLGAAITIDGNASGSSANVVLQGTYTFPVCSGG